MKHIKTILLSVAILFGMSACENQPIEFDDFGSTTVYFPYQTPARCLILGDYPLGFNDNDNVHKFEIGVTMSGVYENDYDRRVSFELDESLLDGVTNVEALPAEYYTIETSSPVTIPKGSIKGRITVQLTDAFFNDPKSIAPKDSVCYVVPLRITSIEKLDYVLTGTAADGVSNPNLLKADDWSVLPKDYTLFGIKFINKYHGKYLRRGVDVLNDGTATTTTVYRDEYVERDEVVSVTTTGMNSVTVSNSIRRGSQATTGNVDLAIAFDDSEKCTLNVLNQSTQEVIGSGTGEFVVDGDAWGGEQQDVIHLRYEYTDASVTPNENHVVNDTLVIRNRDVVFEQFSVYLLE